MKMAMINFFDILALQPNFFNDADIDTRLDKNEIKNAILHRCGTLMPIYTNSEMFKIFSDSFFYQKKEIITKLVDTIELEYNPIDNYRREEEVHRTNHVTSDNKIQGSVERGTTQETKVSAYDSTDYQPKEQTIDGGTDKSTSMNNGTNDVKEDVKTTVTGNIGITTTQKLIMDERKIARFDIYKWIAIEFEQNFFICVS